MTKIDELIERGSCFQKGAINEPMFILLGRDAAAPGTIRDWCARRIALGKNVPGDAQIVDALALADKIEQEHGVIDWKAVKREEEERAKGVLYQSDPCAPPGVDKGEPISSDALQQDKGEAIEANPAPTV